MSSANNNREMLLSAALDGELSVNEKLEFDRLISNDPTFASEFEELQALRADLRLCFSDLRSQTLPPGATQRIVAASMAEADRSREATQPVTHQTNAGPFSRSAKTRWVATVLALAASVLVVIGVWSREKTQAITTPSLLAQLEPENSDVAQPFESEKLSTPQVAEAPTPELAASVPAEPRSEPKPVPKPMAEDVESIAATVPTTPESRPKTMGIKPDALATADAKPKEHVGEPEASVDPRKPAVKRVPLAVVLMFSVELTQSGRDADALDEVLAATGIRLDKESAIGADVVSKLTTANVIKTAVGAENSVASKLYFIEASAKQLDRFMTSVLSDSRSFGTVGMSLVDEPPVLVAVGNLREIDPTKVRQEAPAGFARGLVAADGATWSINPTFAFAPLTRDDVADSGGMQLAMPADIGLDPNGSASTGEDFPAQLLLLVK